MTDINQAFEENVIKFIGDEGWSIEKIVTVGYPAYSDNCYMMTDFMGPAPKIVYYRVRSPNKVVRGSFAKYKDALRFVRRSRFPNKRRNGII